MMDSPKWDRPQPLLYTVVTILCAGMIIAGAGFSEQSTQDILSGTLESLADQQNEFFKANDFYAKSFSVLNEEFAADSTSSQFAMVVSDTNFIITAFSGFESPKRQQALYVTQECEVKYFDYKELLTEGNLVWLPNGRYEGIIATK